VRGDEALRGVRDGKETINGKISLEFICFRLRTRRAFQLRLPPFEQKNEKLDRVPIQNMNAHPVAKASKEQSKGKEQTKIT